MDGMHEMSMQAPVEAGQGDFFDELFARGHSHENVSGRSHELAPSTTAANSYSHHPPPPRRRSAPAPRLVVSCSCRAMCFQNAPWYLYVRPQPATSHMNSCTGSRAAS